MAFGKMLQNLMQRQDIKKMLKEIKKKNINKPAKYTSTNKSKMTMIRSGTVVTSNGLLKNKNTKIKKNKLLGE